jgi:hypothetical protein
MKHLSFLSKFVLFLGCVLAVPSCKYFDLDINKDPNNPSEESPKLVLGNAQLNMAYGIYTLSNTSQGFMNQLSTFDNWSMLNTSYNGTWGYLYATTLQDIQGVINGSVATNDRAENPHFLGIGKLMKAYVFANMVDFWGDVPFSEALQGDDDQPITAPKFDKGEDVYKACLTLIDEAIVDLSKNSPVAVGSADLIYGGSATKWIKFANSLKIKMLINYHQHDASTTAELKALLEEGNYITTDADNFQFNFGKTIAPDYRHPWYQSAYGLDENGFTYISTELMIKMLNNRDPRFPFYFRRQTKTILDQTDPSQRNTTPCSSTVGCVYGYVVLNQTLIDALYPDDDENLDFLAGIFGRDRADPAGLPNDASLRTIPGVYPCGGFYDVANAATAGTNTAPGGGFAPLLTDWHMKFIKTEAILRGIISGDAEATLEDAVRSQMASVVNFGTKTDANSVAPSDTDIDAYVDAAIVQFNAASADNKIKVAMQQLWYASWGSGIELYNMFRRNIDTSVEGSWPGFLQDPIETFGRKFPYRLPYPQNEVSLNPNAAGYASVAYDAVPIFWDKNN